MVVFYIAVLIFCIWQLIRLSKKRTDNTSSHTHTTTSYPYKPGIEYRLPNNRITTNGYAGRHPTQFTHWRTGPNNVYGENIDLADWEDWRINYYGK